MKELLSAMRLSFPRFSVLLVCSVLSTAAAHATGPWQSLYVFGDSFSDSGAGYVDGNGPTAVVYLARQLAIPFTHANDPARAGKGLNFAVSGARTGAGPGQRVTDGLLGLGMRNQVQDFAGRVQRGEITFDPATTLFFIAGGLNDGRTPTEAVMVNLHDEITQLHSLGARHFRVALLPEKIPAFSAAAIRLNPELTKFVATLRLEGAVIRLSRWGAYFDEVMEQPSAYGFSNTTDACAGRKIFGEDTTPKGDPRTFYYYHAGHPSTAVHQIVGEKLAREILADANPG